MSSRVLYQIPLAAWPYRLMMAATCLLFVAALCCWWLPRSIRRLRILLAESRAHAAIGVAFAMIPVAIGFGALVLLIALLRNPQAYVTDAGVTKESLFHRKPTSFRWDEIAHVYCRSENVGALSSIVVVARDGRRIDLGNTGSVDFASMYELLENQLGSEVVQNCDALPGLSR
ncbi:MAG: hypothetical protein ABSG83_13225 [Roseiarcus sp.]|jgi:hypothetical protein